MTVSGYVIDTSSLTALRRNYPLSIAEDIWQGLAELSAAGRLISPREVRRELEKKEDDLFKWAKAQEDLFKDPSSEDIVEAKKIMNTFPGLVEHDKETPDADPFVVACARSRSFVVVADESPAGPGARPKIPDVCKELGVRCIRLVGLIEEVGWRLKRQ